MFKPYTIMANCYDYMLSHVDYNEWYDYINTLMHRYVKNPEKIIEIGTGTGKFGAKFSADKYLIYGMDLSFEMLRVASKRAYKNFKIFCADVRNFKLKQDFDFIFSVHDTFNYLISFEDLEAAFSSVSAIMHSESIFMFDITTEYNIRRYFDNQCESYKINDYRVNWKNHYNYKKRIITSNIEFIDKKGNISTEVHTQKIHSVAEIKQILAKCGFEILDIFSDYTFDPYDDKTVMINFVTRIKN